MNMLDMTQLLAFFLFALGFLSLNLLLLFVMIMCIVLLENIDSTEDNGH